MLHRSTHRERGRQLACSNFSGMLTWKSSGSEKKLALTVCLEIGCMVVIVLVEEV